MRTRLAWVPPFVVGAAAATAASVAVALLLYSGEGMLRSLTLIVGVELMALGVGLAGPPAPEWPGVVVSLRRRWLFVLITFLVASVFTIGWTFGAGFDGGARTQAVGLALLAGLPLYACGYLLAAMSTIGIALEQPRVGASAAVGGALGVVVTGSSVLSRLGAPSVLLFLLVVLSGTALAQGWILGGVEESEGLEETEGLGEIEGLEENNGLEEMEPS